MVQPRGVSTPGAPPKSSKSSRRRRNRKGFGQHSLFSSSLLSGVKVPRCGVFVMLCVLLVIAFEFALMHRHDLDQHSNKDHRFSVPGMPPSFGGGAVPTAARPPRRNHAELTEPPDSTMPKSKIKPIDHDHGPGEAGSEKRRKPHSPKHGSLIGAGDAPPLPQQSDLPNGVRHKHQHQQKQQADDSEDHEGYGDMRVAVLVPYAGPGLPLWFDAFTDLAAASSAAVDWLIFCDKNLAQVKTPPNVKMIDTSPAELAWLLAGVVYPANADEHPDLYVNDLVVPPSVKLTPRQAKPMNARLMAAKFIQKLLSKNPYYMVEFKPALGWVFRDYLKDYTHWAYGDLDVFFGDLTKGWLEPSEMRDYDIITYSFGDQDRAYLRGQLTVHRSIPKVDQIWRYCPHLSRYSQRIETTMETKRYNLESAEGCYSKAVMFSRGIKVKYAVKVFTDMPGGVSAHQEEVVITGDGIVKRCPVELQRRGDTSEPEYGKMQIDVGPYLPVEVAPQFTVCEYWINPTFQTCLELDDGSHQTIFLEDREYYSREYQNLWKDKVEDGCSMGAFHHFQDFKGNYKAWNTRPPMPPVHRGMVAGSGGLVPLPNGDWREMATDRNTPPPDDRDRFTHRYCMESSLYSVRLNGAFSCNVSVTPKDAMHTLYDSRSEGLRRGGLAGGASVTLGAVGGLHDLEVILQSCREWEGPKLIVLLVRHAEVDDIRLLLDTEASNGGIGMENALVVAFVEPDSGSKEVTGLEMPRKTLLNALGDLCQTRHLLTLAPDFRLGRGTEEAVGAALARPSETPRVLVVPQWCVDAPEPPPAALLLPRGEEIPSLDLDDLRRRSQQGTAGLCHLRAGDSADAVVWFGGDVMEDVVDCGEEDEGGGGG